MTWKLKNVLRERLAGESGYYAYPVGLRSRVALIYPNSYFVGMSNLGLHIVYELLNKRDDTACERFFLPEKEELAEYETSRTPLMSLETQSVLADFPLIAFAISFEMDYFHVLKILRMGKVKQLAAERGEREPIVIAGGPCATFNPEPLADFVDAFVIGEGEEIMPHLMDAYYEAKASGGTRQEILRAVASVEGVYVPSLYEPHYAPDGTIKSITAAPGARETVRRQWVRELDDYPAHTVVVTDNTEFKLYLVETARGCGRHCRFCMAGYCFRKPRNRSLSVLKKEIAAAKGLGKRIGLMGAAISDYPEIDGLCDYITDQGMAMSVASFRADSVTVKLVEALAGSGAKTLTIAPEAGSRRMRAVINKGIEEEHVFRTIDLGMAAGIRRFRLYIMIGLPFERPEDVEAIAGLVKKVRNYMRERAKGTRLTVSVNPFVPKPFTPFQWVAMADKKTIEDGFRSLKQSFKGLKEVELLTESPKEAIIQAVLAKGDRRLGKALYLAEENGGAKAFRRALKESGLNEDFYIYRERGEDEIFPWDMLDMGVSRDYLYKELEKALKEQSTVPCFDGCRRCGVCSES